MGRFQLQLDRSFAVDDPISIFNFRREVLHKTLPFEYTNPFEQVWRTAHYSAVNAYEYAVQRKMPKSRQANSNNILERNCSQPLAPKEKCKCLETSRRGGFRTSLAT